MFPDTIPDPLCCTQVLLTTEAPGQVSVYEEDIHGPCPLRKVDEIKPLLRDSETSEEAKRAEKLLAGRPPRDRVAGISAQRMKTADKAARAEGRDEREQLSQILNIPSFSELEGNTTAAVDKLEEKREGKETMRSRARRWVGKKLNVTAAVEKVGLDFDFFEGEVTMLRDLLKGRGVLHHTEAYYYDWITHAFSAAAEKVEEEVGKVGEAVDQGGEPDVEGLKDGMQDAEDQVEAFKETVDEIPAAHYDTAGEEEGGDR